MSKVSKYQQRIDLSRRIHIHELSAMHFCDRCRAFTDFDASVKQICIVLKNNEKCELCIRHKRKCDLIYTANCKKYSVFSCIEVLMHFSSVEDRLNRAFDRIKV